MKTHFELDDHAFERQLEDCTLPAEVFTHEAHLRLAWIHINTYGIEKAIENIRLQLVSYVDALGARDKYNETLTVAAIRVVYHFMLQSKSKNFQDFITEFPRLKYNFKELIHSHYGVDIFSSTRAKQKYLEPDLLPFD